MNTNKVSVIVFDDQALTAVEESRVNVYQSCFELINQSFNGKWQIEVEYCSTPDEIMSLNGKNYQYKLAIVDLVLGDEWPMNSIIKLDKILIEERWPMLLVSAQFASGEAIERVNRLCDSEIKDPAPSQFLLWSSLESVSAGNPRDKNLLAFTLNFFALYFKQ